MTNPTGTPTGSVSDRIEVLGKQLLETVEKLIHEGTVQHLIIKHEGHTILEIPVGIGVAAAVIAPILAAVGAVGAVVSHCTIEVVRTSS